MTGYFSPDAPQNRSGDRFRRTMAGVLKFGPALVSASALIWAAPALAQTTVSSDTTTPLATSKAGDVTINQGGSIKPGADNTAAITIDSNNAANNNGTIFFQNHNNVTGILANGGKTGSINNTGTIEVDDDSQTTTDSNGIIHGPFANGSNRFGIRVIGTGDLTGDVINSATGVMTIKGDTSAAISVETNLKGQLENIGSISVAGTNVFGIHTLGTVSGAVTLGGTLSASGQGAQAANFGNDIGGALLINGTISTTGYRYTTRSTDPNFVTKLGKDDLLQSGASVTVAGNVGGGILLDSTVSTDGTTVTSGSITSVAGAPALVIGSANRNTVIGNVGTGADAFGIEIKGSVVGSGVYDGIASTAMQVGLAGGGTVNTTGGIHILGNVSASAFAASATALQTGSIIAPVLRNEGTITSTMGSDAAGAASTAITIGAGSQVAAFQNTNTITASVVGQKGDAIAIVDHSGSLSEIENIGLIATARTLSTSATATTGRNIALDLSLNTTGVHLLQDLPTGATLTPQISGDVLLGSGGDKVEILAGSLVGKLDLGAGANSLTIDNASTVKGNLDANGGTVALNLANGTLQINDASQLKLTSLAVGGSSTLVVTADPATNQATSLAVNGTATIANGAKIGVRLASILPGSATYTLISANQLNAGSLSSSLLGDTPFLYNTSLQTNATAGTITATLSRKTAAQLGLSAATASAYEPLIAVIGKDTGLEGALLAQTSRSGLVTLFNQMLPNHSASIFNSVAASTEAFGRPLDDRQDPVGGGFWMQEVNAGVFGRNSGDNPGYKAWSFGAIAGYEIPRTPLGILGVTFGASTNQIYPDAVDSAEDLHANMVDLGLYWRATKGGFSANARVAANYVKVSSTRVVEVLGGDGLAVNRTSSGEWSGVGFNAHAMASYEKHFGNYYLRPLANVDYVRLAEGSYTENGGGPLDLSVASRTSSRLSAFAGVAVGALYGPDRSWGPEALVGYRTVANESLGSTNAKFVGGGDPFTLQADQISGSGAAVHLSLRGENGSGGFAVETGAEARDGLNIYDLRLTGHVQF